MKPYDNIILGNIITCNSLLPDGIKPSPGPFLVYYDGIMQHSLMSSLMGITVKSLI